MSDLPTAATSSAASHELEANPESATRFATSASLGSDERPLGSEDAALAASSYLLGLRCGCGRSVLVVAAVFHSSRALSCPDCHGSLR